MHVFKNDDKWNFISYFLKDKQLEAVRRKENDNYQKINDCVPVQDYQDETNTGLL